MDKDFDFDKIGKRMPYTVPDGFFEKLEDRIAREAKPRKNRGVTIALSSIAAAACVASAVMISGIFNKPETNGIESVDKAFAQLSEQDQDYLLSVYNDDVFINSEISN